MVLSLSEKQILIAIQSLLLRNKTTSMDEVDAYGSNYFCSYKRDWNEGFQELIRRNIIGAVNKNFYIKKEYVQYSNWLIEKYPRFLYWYNDWYRFGETSKAHALICKKAYGINLSQTGMTTKKQIDYIVKEVIQENKFCLDLGCGSGRILEYISDHCHNRGIGIDMVSNGIKFALKRTQDKRDRLHYYQRSMLELNQFKQKFDYIFAFDTFYFVQENLEKIIDDCFKILNVSGKILILYSAWNPKDENFNPGQTFLGNLLNEKEIKFEWIDFTEDEIEHWLLKYDAIKELKEEIIQEGSIQIYENLFNEAKYFANLSKQEKIVRYLYVITKGEENDEITIN